MFFFFLYILIYQLKRIPNGKWQCPKCCQKSDSLEPMSHLDSISKRARTKIVSAKSKSEIKSSGTEKVSRIFGSSILGKKRSAVKAKSAISRKVCSIEKKLDSSQIDVSSSPKPSHPSVGGSIEGSSSSVFVDNEKKPDLTPTGTPTDRKSNSAAKEVLPLSRDTALEPNDEASGRKPDLSCDNGTSGNKLIHAMDAATRKARKRKHKVNSDDSQKKSRTDKGKHAANTSKKSGSKANSMSPETSRSHRKRRTADKGVSAGLSKEDVGIKSSDVQKKNEVSLSLSIYLLLPHPNYMLLLSVVSFFHFFFLFLSLFSLEKLRMTLM